MCVHKILAYNLREKNSIGQHVVTLDPNEHQSYLWATEDEVKAKSSSGVVLQFTRPEQERLILEAFKQTTKPNGTHN